MDATVKEITSGFIIGLVACCLWIAWVAYEPSHCVKSHSEVVHHPAGSSYTMIGGKVPVYYSYDAYDSAEQVCDAKTEGHWLIK